MQNTTKQIGTLSEQQIQKFAELKQNAIQLVNQLGSLELKKYGLIEALNKNETDAQNLLSQIKFKFDLKEDQAFQILDDGTVIVKVVE
jgi:hypothetical protein